MHACIDLSDTLRASLRGCFPSHNIAGACELAVFSLQLTEKLDKDGPGATAVLPVNSAQKVAIPHCSPLFNHCINCVIPKYFIYLYMLIYYINKLNINWDRFFFKSKRESTYLCHGTMGAMLLIAHVSSLGIKKLSVFLSLLNTLLQKVSFPV